MRLYITGLLVLRLDGVGGGIRACRRIAFLSFVCLVDPLMLVSPRVIAGGLVKIFGPSRFYFLCCQADGRRGNGRNNDTCDCKDELGEPRKWRRNRSIVTL